MKLKIYPNGTHIINLLSVVRRSVLRRVAGGAGAHTLTPSVRLSAAAAAATTAASIAAAAAASASASIDQGVANFEACVRKASLYARRALPLSCSLCIVAAAVSQ
jgi:hypothetical protein